MVSKIIFFKLKKEIMLLFSPNLAPYCIEFQQKLEFPVHVKDDLIRVAFLSPPPLASVRLLRKLLQGAILEVPGSPGHGFSLPLQAYGY